MTTLSPAAAERLSRRTPIPVDPSGIAIKRNLQAFDVGCDAATFGRAFAAVMADPTRRYGPIVVKRPVDRAGQPFVAGDRFTGCFTLGPAWGPVVWLEDTFASDYAEIVAVTDHEVEYRYLSGSPIAGRSTLRIVPIDPSRCRFEALFEYQEIGTLAIAAIQAFGHHQHDRVVAAQVEQAAAFAGARVLGSTVRG